MTEFNIDTEYFKKKLQERSDELQKFIAEHADDSKPVELDQQSVGRLSRMEAMQDQAMAVEVRQRRQDELLRIEAALQRIENDEYGCCVSCGEEIPKKRLELDPSISKCVDCAG